MCTSKYIRFIHLCCVFYLVHIYIFYFRIPNFGMDSRTRKFIISGSKCSLAFSGDGQLASFRLTFLGETNQLVLLSIIFLFASQIRHKISSKFLRVEEIFILLFSLILYYTLSFL